MEKYYYSIQTYSDDPDTTFCIATPIEFWITYECMPDGESQNGNGYTEMLKKLEAMGWVESMDAMFESYDLNASMKLLEVNSEFIKNDKFSEFVSELED